MKLSAVYRSVPNPLVTIQIVLLVSALESARIKVITVKVILLSAFNCIRYVLFQAAGAEMHDANR